MNNFSKKDFKKACDIALTLVEFRVIEAGNERSSLSYRDMMIGAEKMCAYLEDILYLDGGDEK